MPQLSKTGTFTVAVSMRWCRSATPSWTEISDLSISCPSLTANGNDQTDALSGQVPVLDVQQTGPVLQAELKG